MSCPNCGSKLLKETFQDQIIVICSDCYGVWCPTNNIGLCIRLLIDSDFDLKKTNESNPEPENKGWLCDAPSYGDISKIEKPGSTTGPAFADDDTEPAIRKCPSCESELTIFYYDPDSKIVLDECRDCRHVWINRDMVDTLADYLSLSKKKPAQKLNTFPSAELENDDTRINGTEQALEAYFKNAKPAYEDTIDIPIIRRILGIPCVERNLSMTPWATITIIAANVLLFLIAVFSPNDMVSLFNNLGFIPARLSSEPLTALFTFFTSMFMHAGLGHLFSNMMFLWLFGGRIEEDYGTTTFIAVYLIAGTAAGLSHTITNLGSVIPAIGASGAISGILGAFFILHPKNRVVTYFMLIPIPMSAALFLGFWFSMQIINSLLTASAGGAGIAWFAHIGGFIAGAVMAYPLKQHVKLVAEEQQKIAA